jgi:hypothetical protein
MNAEHNIANELSLTQKRRLIKDTKDAVKKRFIVKYETLSKTQQNAVRGSAYDRAEKWLRNNKDRYLEIIGNLK